MSIPRHHYFPCSLNVNGKSCLVIGDGKDATEKSSRLADAGAKVAVVVPSEFDLKDITEQFLVVLCTKGDPEFTKDVARVCREKRILFCAIDQPDFCDVINVAVFDKGRLRMAIGTGGAAPAVSKKIRQGLERSLRDQPVDAFLDDLAELRVLLEKESPDSKDRISKLLEATEGFEFSAIVKFPNKWLLKRKEKRK